jgi:hypothetical protein
MASIEMISYLTGPYLGSAKMGIVAEHYGVKTALVSGGALCIVAVGLTALFLPKFWRYDGREGRTRREFEESVREKSFNGQEKIVNDALERIAESEW